MSDRLEQSTILDSNGTQYEIGRSEHGWLTIRRVEEVHPEHLRVLSEEMAFPPGKKDQVIEAIEDVEF